jgi:acyl-coenzyme A thioesterase PaaI-like protein
MDDRGVEALTELAAATRELVRQVRITMVDADALDRARALVDEAAALVAEATYGGPHAQTGNGEMDFNLSPRVADFFPYSPVVGPLNPISPPVEIDIGEDGTLFGTVTLTEAFNGPPFDYVHGGVVALVFDEMLGTATIAGAGGGFTARLTVRYHKPTPIGVPLRLEARVTEVKGRKITAHGTIHDGDTLTAEAEGLFISVGGTLADHHA